MESISIECCSLVSTENYNSNIDTNKLLKFVDDENIDSNGQVFYHDIELRIVLYKNTNVEILNKMYFDLKDLLTIHILEEWINIISFIRENLTLLNDNDNNIINFQLKYNKKFNLIDNKLVEKLFSRDIVIDSFKNLYNFIINEEFLDIDKTLNCILQDKLLFCKTFDDVGYTGILNQDNNFIYCLDDTDRSTENAYYKYNNQEDLMNFIIKTKRKTMNPIDDMYVLDSNTNQLKFNDYYYYNCFLFAYTQKNYSQNLFNINTIIIILFIIVMFVLILILIIILFTNNIILHINNTNIHNNNQKTYIIIYISYSL